MNTMEQTILPFNAKAQEEVKKNAQMEDVRKQIEDKEREIGSIYAWLNASGESRLLSALSPKTPEQQASIDAKLGYIGMKYAQMKAFSGYQSMDFLMQLAADKIKQTLRAVEMANGVPSYLDYDDDVLRTKLDALCDERDALMSL